MAYIDIDNAAMDSNHVLRKQVRAACMHVALDIANELPSTQNHPARLSWARAAFRDPSGIAAKAVWAVLRASAPIQANPTAASDGDVRSALWSMIDTLAGEV